MASLHISSTLSAQVCKFNANTCYKVIVFIETYIFFPVCFINFYQWRSAIDPNFNLVINGIDYLKEDIFKESLSRTGFLAYFTNNFFFKVLANLSPAFCSCYESSFDHKVAEKSLIVFFTSL